MTLTISQLRNILLLTLVSGFCYGQSIQFSEEEQAWIDAHPVVNFGYEPDWPPYEIYANGEYTGIVGEYVHILEEQTGIDFRPIPDVSWEEALTGLEEGTVNFVPSCAITESRKDFLDFTSTIVSDPLVIVTRRDSKFIGGMSYLNYKTIVLPKNYYTLELIKADFPKIRILERDKIEECLTAVSTGEAEAFVGSLGVVSYYVNHSGFTNLKIAAPTDYENVQIGMAVTKDWSTLRDIAQKVIDEIPVKTHHEIRQKWISVRYEYGITPRELALYIIFGVIILVFIAVASVLWNRSLKREIIKRNEVERQLSSSLVSIQKQSEERKLLLQEIHHRVKNNLQIVSSMLKLQAINSEENDIPVDFYQTIDRINAISMIHEMIYKSKNIDVENIEAYLSALVTEIIRAHSPDENIQIETHVHTQGVNLKTLVPMAIIINELVVNSVKHAFKSSEKGLIRLNVTTEGNVLAIEYSDDGTWIEPTGNRSGFGSSLIDIFTEQLEGSYTRTTDMGTVYRFTLQLQNDQ